jgi:uncharacterized protein
LGISGYYAWFAARRSEPAAVGLARGVGDVSERTSRQEHRFDAFRLSASHGEVAGTLAPAALERLDDRLYEGEDEDAGDGRIDWSIRGAADNLGRPALTVSIEGSLALQCQRCLGRLDLPLSQATTVLLARNDAELVQLDEASEQEVVLANAPLDAVALVEDELLLTLPFAPRHEDDCAEADAANER